MDPKHSVIKGLYCFAYDIKTFLKYLDFELNLVHICYIIFNMFPNFCILSMFSPNSALCQFSPNLCFLSKKIPFIAWDFLPNYLNKDLNGVS